MPLVRQDFCGNHAAVRQRDADPVACVLTPERKEPVSAAKPVMQAVQVESIGCVGRGRRRRKVLEVQLRKRPCDIRKQPWPFGRRRGAEKLERCRELAVTAVDRWIGLIRPMEQKGRGEDEMDRDDRGHHQRGDLSADTPQIQEADPLHDQPLAGNVSASTRGVNI